MESTGGVEQGYALERMMRWIRLGVGVGLGGTDSSGWQRSCLQEGHSPAFLFAGLHQSSRENMRDGFGGVNRGENNERDILMVEGILWSGSNLVQRKLPQIYKGDPR